MATELLVVQSIVFVLGLRYLLKRDILIGTVYFFLFIYVIFAQVGYYYFPQLSELLIAHFGESVWFSATYFIILSFVAIILVFATSWRRLVNAVPFRLRIGARRKSELAIVFILVISLVWIAFNAYLIANWDIINYETAQEVDFSSTPAYFAFYFVFKFSVAIIYALYSIWRGGGASVRIRVLGLLLMMYGVSFSIAAFKLGNRTDILALVVGVCVFEVVRAGSIKKALARLTVVFVTGLAFLLSIQFFRKESDGWDGGSVFEVLLLNDYFAPAHMLFAAIHFQMIDPLEVLTSNLANAAIMMDYPLLQAPITDQFREGMTTRSQSYGFLLLTEGFLFMGVFGFLYNGLVLVAGLAIWRRISSTNCPEFNSFAVGLCACMAVNLVRSQSAYLVKYLYMFVAPAIFVYLPLARKTISLSFGARQRLALPDH